MGSSPATRESSFLWVPALGITLWLWSLPASTPSAWAPARDILSCQHTAYAPKLSSLLLTPEPHTRVQSTTQAQVQLSLPQVLVCVRARVPLLPHWQAQSTALL